MARLTPLESIQRHFESFVRARTTQRKSNRFQKRRSLLIVLGVHDGHNATAALLCDGSLRACISEERLTRTKNQAGYPRKAIDGVLKASGVAPKEVDLVAFGSQFSVPGNEFVTGRFIEAYKRRYSASKRARNMILSTLRAANSYKRYAWFRNRNRRKARASRVISHLGLSEKQVRFVEHHECHAAAAYFGSGWRNSTLILTCDGEGDGVCATVNVGKYKEIERLSETPSVSSLGNLYSRVTFLLGMKPLDHEYKVMGLAPYADTSGAEKSYERLRGFIALSQNDDLTFRNLKGVPSQFFYQILREELQNHRFDWVAGAIQRLTEELLLNWAQAAMKKTGLKQVACSGGVFMNVKANLRLAEELDHSGIFIFPSSGDESVAIGAAFSVASNGSSDQIRQIRELYLGPEYGDTEIKGAIQDTLAGQYHVEQYSDIEARIAEILAKGGVVARMNGRMEWGARALGNRSILANPSKLDVVRTINRMIKMRDFWMPFAPTIMHDRQARYLENPKGVKSPYMMLAFRTVENTRGHITAALHQYDFTARPQILEADWNPAYNRILERFEAETGIGGVLNTSFNLHGEPIVCSPSDAVDTMQRSGLEHLGLGNFLISRG